MVSEPAVSPAGEPDDDAAVIQQSRDHPERFAMIFDRHVDEIHRYVARRLGAEVAEDVVGETFLTAFRQRTGFEPRRRDARPWLYGIATNLMRRHRRSEVRKYRAMQRVSVAPVEDHADDVVAVVSMESVRRRLGKALAGLRRGDLDVLLLVTWEELSYEEAAEALAIPVGTVRSRLNRARRKVREGLNVTGSGPAREERTYG